MSPNVEVNNAVHHFVARPWPNRYAPLISQLASGSEKVAESLPNVQVCVVSARRVWDAPRLLEPLSPPADTSPPAETGVLVHAWNPVIADALLDALAERGCPLVVQCNSATELQADAPLVRHCQSKMAIRLVATSEQTAERLTALGVDKSLVSCIPWVDPPGGEDTRLRATFRKRWHLADEDIVVSVLPSVRPGAMYAVAWAAFLVHEAVPKLRLLMAGANRDQRRSEWMASGCGKARIARFLADTPAAEDFGEKDLDAQGLIAAADLVVIPENTKNAEELALAARQASAPVIRVAEVLHPQADTRPDHEHPFHDLAAEMLASIDALADKTPSDHTAQQAAWSQQVADYRQIYTELLSTASA